MGKDRHQITNTMKAFIFLCLVAAAMAEADPQFLYGNYGYNTFPSTYAYGGAYSPYTYGYNSFHYGKHEAEADPALIYSSGYHYPLRLRRHPPPRQEGGRGRPRSRLQQRLPLPH